MPLNSKHPEYNKYLPDWELMRDAYAGERTVKEEAFKYLPATPGQVLDGAYNTKTVTEPVGLSSYKAYRARARFPNYVEQAVKKFIGMLHQKEAVIELPPRMQPMLEKATQDGETMINLLRRINEYQLVTGRLGLLVDLPLQGTIETLPYIAVYCAESPINWDNSADHEGVNALNFVVLNESGSQRDDAFEWKDHERYRVLMLGIPTEAGMLPLDATEGAGEPVYFQGSFDITNGQDYTPTAMQPPVLRGKTLDQIPFVFVNSTDITPSPSKPPLLGLGELCMTIYRADADYRHTLFMQGQDTLVVIGQAGQGGEINQGDQPIKVGAGARIDLDIAGDAKFIGVSAAGIEGQRESLRDDKAEADGLSGTLISPAAGKQESGDALSTRLAAQTASLTRIAQTGAAALENSLRIVAEWMGENPLAVSVTPNLEFALNLVTAQELAQLMGARTMGAPLSLESIHGVMVDRGLTKFDYETELDKIAEEDLERAKHIASLPQPPAPPAPPPN